MDIEVKQIGIEEHKIAVEWGKKKHDFPIMPFEILPKRGFMSFVDGVPVFAAWMYITDEHLMGFIAYVIANPGTDTHHRKIGFEALMNEFENEAEKQKISFFFTSGNTGSLVTRMKNDGFTVCDPDVVHLIKKPRYLLCQKQ